MAQSPELAAGTGFTFEDLVAADYYAAMLAEGYAPGLPDRTICRVARQQRSFGDPLDDVIIDGRDARGETARLGLQVKQALTVSAANSNADFREVIRDSWATFTKDDFRLGSDRYGVAVGHIAVEKKRALTQLCEFARESLTLDEFECRFAATGNAGPVPRAVKADFATVLGDLLGHGCPAADLHQFLAHFVLVEFDFLHEGCTDEPAALQRLRECLISEQADLAPLVWTKFCQIARQSAGRSGAYDRPRLVAEISKSARLRGAASLRDDLNKIEELTRSWIADIDNTVGGTCLDRPSHYNKLEDKLAVARTVQIRGLPGSGKSVLLRQHVEANLAHGPVLLLKYDRLEGKGWASFATANNLSRAALLDLLVEVGAAGTRTVYIDGIDRIEKANHGIILDVVKAIMDSPLLADWKIVVSLRDTGVEPLRNWMNDLLVRGGIETVEVGPLDDDEARALAAAQSHLSALLFGPQPVQAIVRRPFFAKILNQSFSGTGADAAFAPQSEIDLINNWWERGGYDSSGQNALGRQLAITELAQLRSRRMSEPIAVSKLSPAAFGVLNDLIEDGILQHQRRGITIRFAHDIFFEWGFFNVSAGRPNNWLDEIRSCGEPPALGRVVELLSQQAFGEARHWDQTLEQVSQSAARSQWTRAWLLGPLSAVNFNQARDRYFTSVSAHDFRYLEKALVWFQAERTTPNSGVLAMQIGSDERIRLADALGWPADIATWARFLWLLLAHIDDIPIRLYPDLAALFEVWENAFVNLENDLSKGVLTKCAAWLEEIDGLTDESAKATPKWEPLGSERKNFQHTLSRLILRQRTMPDLSANYLKRTIGSDRLRGELYMEIVAYAGTLAQEHPELLAELTLKHLMKELPTDRIRRERDEVVRAAERRARVMAKPPEERTSFDDRMLEYGHSLIGAGMFSMSDWQVLSIDRDPQRFSPPSPLREPFRSLFTFSPDTALRLLADLSNHAITAWRQLHELDRERPGTPIPVTIAFPWGTQEFWGSSREYLWYRGTSAPPALACGYMALEEWCFKELEGGRPTDDIIAKIVAGNRCIAILGACVTIVLQAENASEAGFALVVSPRLWLADYNRFRQDLSNNQLNLIGFTSNDETSHIEALQHANARDVRKKRLNWLAGRYVVLGDALYAERTKTALQSFKDNLPYEFEEQRSDLQTEQWLLQFATEAAELTEIENYRAYKMSEDTDEIAIIHVSPSASTPESKAKIEAARASLTRGNLWAWASKTFEEGELSGIFTLGDAIEHARAFDRPSLYSGAEDDNYELGMCKGAVAATAAVALCHREGLAEADLRWARDVVRRAMRAPEKRGLFWSSHSVIPWHEGIYAARAIAADIRYGTVPRNAARDLLTLVAHPLEGVSVVALEQALSLWDLDAKLAWCALYLAFRLCHIDHTSVPKGPSDPIHSAQSVRKSIDSALRSYRAAGTWPDLPLPPPAWIKVDSALPRSARRARLVRDVREEDLVTPTEVWGEPLGYWYDQYAAKVLSKIPNDKAISPGRKEGFLTFLDGLLAWTIEKIAPSWIKRHARDTKAAQLHEWTRTIGSVLGKVAGLMSLEEARATFVEPILALDEDPCFSLLEPFVSSLICVHIYDAEVVPDNAIPLLSLCLDRMLESSTFNRNSYRAGELFGFDLPSMVESFMFVSIKHAAKAARLVNGDWSEVGLVLPIVDQFVRKAAWSSAVMGRYLKLCERAREVYPADQFADQVLAVLEDKAGLKGWRGTFIPARIAALVQHFADRDTPMPLALDQKLLRILDLLVDMGDRRSAALQLSETFREIQTAA